MQNVLGKTHARKLSAETKCDMKVRQRVKVQDADTDAKKARKVAVKAKKVRELQLVQA